MRERPPLGVGVMSVHADGPSPRGAVERDNARIRDAATGIRGGGGGGRD